MSIVMHDMEMDDEDQRDLCLPSCPAPKYPYGLCISLDEKSIEKLNLDPAEAFVGGIIHGHFLGRITSVSANDTTEGTKCRVEIQIESMAIESEDEENEEADRG